MCGLYQDIINWWISLLKFIKWKFEIQCMNLYEYIFLQNKQCGNYQINIRALLKILEETVFSEVKIVSHFKTFFCLNKWIKHVQ